MERCIDTQNKEQGEHPPTGGQALFRSYEAIKINFHLNEAPNFRDLLITHDIHLHKEFYIIQKIGHIAAFGLLFILLLATIKRFTYAFILCSLFAFFTELLQLYFQRNGRLFDVGVDILGILIALFLCKAFTPIFMTREVNEG